MPFPTHCVCVCAQLCLMLGDPMDCSPPDSSVHGIFPCKNTGVGCHFLLWGGLSNPGTEPTTSCISWTGRWILYHWAAWAAKLRTHWLSFFRYWACFRMIIFISTYGDWCSSLLHLLPSIHSTNESFSFTSWTGFHEALYVFLHCPPYKPWFIPAWSIDFLLHWPMAAGDPVLADHHSSSAQLHLNKSIVCELVSRLYFKGYRRPKRHRFDPWVRKTPWRRTQQPTPILLPGESRGQRSQAGHSPRGHRDLRCAATRLKWWSANGCIFGCIAIFQFSPEICITWPWYAWSTQLELRAFFGYLLYAMMLASSRYVLSTRDSDSSRFRASKIIFWCHFRVTMHW